VAATEITTSVFSILRVPAERGRAVQPADERPGAEPVVVLSHELWRRRFGGVMPAGFHFPAQEVELWMPLTIDPANLQVGAFHFQGIGRLRAGVSPEAAS